MTNHELLKKLVYNGARSKKLPLTDIVLDRLSYELSIIEKQGFSDYFILYSRIIEVCNELNLLRSYNRGSAANSIVNYCLDITKINPIEENLIFERFILPQQIKLPDIDIDIPKGHQKNVIEKLKQKYPEYNAYFIASLLRKETDYKDVFYNNTVYKKHPCGIIITTEKLSNLNTFLYEEQEYYLALNQQAKDEIYDVTFDLVEQEVLNRLQIIVNQIGEKYHPYKLPLNDEKVFNLFTTGDLDNIFLFNYPTLKPLLAQFKPNSIYDLSIIFAMYRPPLTDYIPTIIHNKFNGNNNYFYSDARVSDILNETYGILIYQETFLKLLIEIAGLNFDEAEIWRRNIMRDKSNTEINAFIPIFNKGCKKHSTLNDIEITSLTNLIVNMINYTFPKTHSLSYSIIGYWCAYYKTYFKAEFDKAYSSNII
jgi:DNA polymerase-3 subunit alpha